MFSDQPNSEKLSYKRSSIKKVKVKQEDILSEKEINQDFLIDGASIIGDQQLSLLDGDIPFQRNENNDPSTPEEANTLGEQMRINEALSSVAGFVRQKFQEAVNAREKTEKIWIEAFLAYRGEYDSEQQRKISEYEQRNPGAFKGFIKITKTKVQAAHSQILDILFSESKFPIGVEPTPVPDGIAETAYIAPEDQQDTSSPDVGDIYGYKGDGREIEPGATSKSLLSGLYEKYSSLLKGKKVVEGPSPDKQNLIQISPAEEAAYNMNRLMLDQLEESDAEEMLSRASLEMCLFGTGAIKGPFNYKEVIHQYDQDPETKKITYNPKVKLSPKFSNPSIWNIYPDPDAHRAEDASYIVERHLLSREKLRSLTSLELFSKEAVLETLRTSPVVTKYGWEEQLRDSTEIEYLNRYEVLEYWGYLNKELAEAAKLDLSEFEDDLLDVVQVNIWVCNGIILRMVVNPFTPRRIPYFLFPYEEHPYQIWGIGIPENMRDPQMLINGHMRMAVDNLKLSGSVMLEVNEAQFKPGQDFAIYPGKVWRKQGGAPGQSIYGITIPNTTNYHLQMFDFARRQADETTGLPSFAHGQTGVSGVGRTAGGISMLMSAAAGTIKKVIRNIDDRLLEPLGEALFQWNMQFNEENCDIRGDLKIIASGTKSIMQREVLTQRLISFMQVAGGNPATAPMVNLQYIIKEIAISMGLDPDKAVNDMEKAMLYAELMSKANGQENGAAAQQPSPAQGGVQNPSQGVSGNDPTGGGAGNIGVGAGAVPGEAAFSANGVQ